MSIMTCPNVNVTDVTWDWNKLSAKCPFNRTNETLGLPLSRRKSEKKNKTKSFRLAKHVSSTLQRGTHTRLAALSCSAWAP